MNPLNPFNPFLQKPEGPLHADIIVPHGKRTVLVKINDTICMKMATHTYAGAGHDVERWQTIHPVLPGRENTLFVLFDQ